MGAINARTLNLQQGGENADVAMESNRIDSGVADSELVRLPLEKIQERATEDTRALNEQMVADIKDSIRVIGLIQPIAIDKENRLLAGGHRRAALFSLQQESPDEFEGLFPQGIPCRRFNFDSATDPELALKVEVEENEKRRNYTKKEVLLVAERLQQHGFSAERGRGNTKPLYPELMRIFGASRSTVQRILREPNRSIDQFDGDAPDEPVAPAKKTLSLDAETVDALRAYAKAHKKDAGELANKVLRDWLARKKLLS